MYVRRGSFIWVTRRIHVCHSCKWHDSVMWLPWLIHMGGKTHSYAWRDAFIDVCCDWVINHARCIRAYAAASVTASRFAFLLLQCVAVCCRSACLLLLCIAVAVSCRYAFPLLLCVTVCCGVVQCVAAHPCVALCCGVVQHIRLLQCVSACCSTSVDLIRISTSFMYACVYLRTYRHRRVHV